MRDRVEAEIIAARQDQTRPDNPVAVETSRLIAAHAAEYRAFASRLGYCPDSFFSDEPKSPIETVAEAVAQEIIREIVTRYHGQRTFHKA